MLSADSSRQVSTEQNLLSPHLPVLLNESVNALVQDASGWYVDGTFGRGGHSRAILERLSENGRLLCLDRDIDAIHSDAANDLRQENRCQFVHASLSSMATVLNDLGWMEKVSGILMDLGVSSPQLDIAERGFSFMRAGPLDMRMDRTRGLSAAEWLAEVSETELIRVLREYGEERFARRIAQAIVAERVRQPINTTTALADLIAAATPRVDRFKHPATRSFQAIRIAVNDELGELKTALTQSTDALKPGGRLAVISFHSLEDRLVKRFMRDQEQGDPSRTRRPWIEAAWVPRLHRVGKAIRPAEAELAMNARARSATLRVASRAAA